jgi:hypothetical protein
MEKRNLYDGRGRITTTSSQGPAAAEQYGGRPRNSSHSRDGIEAVPSREHGGSANHLVWPALACEPGLALHHECAHRGTLRTD